MSDPISILRIVFAIFLGLASGTFFAIAGYVFMGGNFR